MARRRRSRSRTRTIVRRIGSSRTGRRISRSIRSDRWKRDLLKGGKGALLGLAISIPMTLAASRLGQPMLTEVGQRGGAIAASAIGGTAGQVGYQLVDALADRFVRFQGNAITGQGSVGL